MKACLLCMIKADESVADVNTEHGVHGTDTLRQPGHLECPAMCA